MMMQKYLLGGRSIKKGLLLEEERTQKQKVKWAVCLLFEYKFSPTILQARNFFFYNLK